MKPDSRNLMEFCKILTISRTRPPNPKGTPWVGGNAPKFMKSGGTRGVSKKQDMQYSPTNTASFRVLKFRNSETPCIPRGTLLVSVILVVSSFLCFLFRHTFSHSFRVFPMNSRFCMNSRGCFNFGCWKRATRSIPRGTLLLFVF